MSETKTTVWTSITVGDVLGLIFVTLKLTGVINWSWWLVTFPFWGPYALVLVTAGLGCVGYGLFVLFVWLWALRSPKKR